jgi:PAS domain S-box-containing protein
MMTVDLFAGGGEMGALMRSHDWSQTPLGPVSQWPQSLKTSVSIILNSRHPMFVWWGSQYISLYNDAYCPILGASKHPQFLGQSAKDCWAEIWDAVGPLADSVRSTGQPTWSEDLLLLMNRNGYLEETYFTFSYSPVRDESGNVEGVFCACSETTKQIVGERRLQTLRDLASNSVEAKTVEEACRIATHTLSKNPYDVPFALLYLVDEDTGRQARLTGTAGIEIGAAKSLQQIDLTQAIDLWNLARVKSTLQAQLIEDLPTRFGALPGGAWPDSPNAALVMPIATGQKQQLAGALVLGISPRREFDDEYRGFFDLVASQVTTAIANADAYEAECKRAEALAELDRAKTTFFSNISHELRTPLTLMLGSLEETLLGNEPLSKNQRNQLQVSLRNSLRLLKLINTLLDFSRIEAGRIDAAYEPTDLSTFTCELASVFRSAIERTGMQLVVDCPPLPEPIYIDREMWEKIVLNLLSNAFKFTFEGEIRVSLRSYTDRVELDVRDTGIGIPESYLPHLFERFHRVPGARGRTYEGSGIGLSLVQELARLHGGTIAVTSLEGQGSCFTVSIPTGFLHLPQNQIASTRTLVSTATGASPYIEEALCWLPQEAGEQGSKLDIFSCVPQPLHPSNPSARILFVDDNADMRDYVRRLLSQQYEVETVADGMTAAASIRQQAPDLVLTDVMIPQLDGFGLLRELRTDPATRELPIILLSARAGEEARVEGLKAGADDYLIKPFSARELLARVEANLKLSRMRQEAVQQEQVLRQEAESVKARLESVLSSINNSFVVLDSDWRFVYANDRAAALSQVPKAALLGQRIWDVFPVIGGSLIETEFHRAVVEQRPIQFEYFFPPQNRWYEHYVYPIANGLSVFTADITQRKQAELALQESETRYRQLVELSPNGIFIQSEGRFVFANQAAVSLFGATEKEQLLGKRVVDMISPEYRSAVVERIEQLRNTQVIPLLEEKWLRLDGTVVDVEVAALPFTYQGKCAAQVIVRDISDRKRVEDEREQAQIALQQSEARARLAIEVGRLGTWSYNPKTDLVEMDKRMCEIWGEIDTALPLPRVLERIHPNDRQRVVNAISAALAPSSSGTYEIDYRLVWNNGTERWVLANGQVQFEGEGASRLAIGFIGTALDITERKQAEEALRESEELKQRILESSNDCIKVLTLDGQILYINTGGLSLLEIDDPTLLLNNNWLDFWHDEDLERAKTAIAAAKAGNIGQFQGYCYCQITKAEPKCWDSVITPIRDASGQVAQLVVISRDITQQKQAESEREQLLAREQAAREQAETANRIKDEFLAVLSHELRSPLNPILGWAKLLQSRTFDEQKTKQALATIERNAKLQTQLIEDLLDVSRILRGKLVLNRVPVNLTSTIEAALETVRLAAEAKAIDLQFIILDFEWKDTNNPKSKIQNRLFQVLGDSTRLQQVIWNLVSNAIKFTPSGGAVEIRLEQIDTYAQIQVKDNGKGIDREFLPYVFEYFRQEDGTTTRKFGGLGLGLAIVRHLVELHGGNVWAESPGEGLGATFIVRLPLLPASTQTPPDYPQTTSMIHLMGLQILVVDDEPDIRDIVSFILEQAGAIVRVAASASEALNLIEQSLPDVLVCDVGMADMDGYMLMRLLRKQPPEKGGKIPAIALTAYAGESDRQLAIASGFQRHITKPVEPDELLRAIKILLEEFVYHKK